jgi:hypothetical protein
MIGRLTHPYPVYDNPTAVAFPDCDSLVFPMSIIALRPVPRGGLVEHEGDCML